MSAPASLLPEPVTAPPLGDRRLWLGYAGQVQRRISGAATINDRGPKAAEPR